VRNDIVEVKQMVIDSQKLLVTISFLILLLMPHWSFGQSLLEEAKTEREVVLYTTMPVTIFAVFSSAAKEKYPFLTIRHVHLSTIRQVAKVMQEHRSDKLQADILGINLTEMLYYKKEGVLGKYLSPEAKQLVKGFVDRDGFWVGVNTDFLITGFNTKLISKNEVPRNYVEYLSPKYRGLMAINTGAGPYGLIGMTTLKGEEQGITYMRQLSKQDLRPVEGFNHMTNLLAAGEFPLAIFTQVSKVDELKEKGAPVDWLSSSPTFSTISTIAIVRKPSHPAAARLLFDFYISAEGQQALVRAGKIPLRREIKTPSVRISNLLNSGDLQLVEPKGDFGRYQKIYGDLLGIR
jgi:iron(III) transport system substrate-binding protein